MCCSLIHSLKCIFYCVIILDHIGILLLSMLVALKFIILQFFLPCFTKVIKLKNNRGIKMCCSLIHSLT